MASKVRPEPSGRRAKQVARKGGSAGAPPGQPHSISVRVPLTIRKRGGRKLILAPDGTHIGAPTAVRPVDSTIVRALARAFRWREMLETGQYATIREIAVAEKINEVYVGRILRLTLLAPEIIEEMLSNRSSAEPQSKNWLKRFPVEWRAQKQA